MLIVKYRVTLVDDFQRDPFTDSTRCLGRTNCILVVIDIKRHLATQNTRHEFKTHCHYLCPLCYNKN